MIYIILSEVHTNILRTQNVWISVLVTQTLHKQQNPESICSDDIMLAQKWF